MTQLPNSFPLLYLLIPFPSPHVLPGKMEGWVPPPIGVWVRPIGHPTGWPDSPAGDPRFVPHSSLSASSWLVPPKAKVFSSSSSYLPTSLVQNTASSLFSPEMERYNKSICTFSAGVSSSSKQAPSNFLSRIRFPEVCGVRMYIQEDYEFYRIQWLIDMLASKSWLQNALLRGLGDL